MDQPKTDKPGGTGERAPAAAKYSRALFVLLTCVCAGALAYAGTWSAYWAEHRYDQYALIYLGQCINEGGAIYADCWENKPPGMAWINALGMALSGGRQTGAWIAPGVALLLCLAAAGIAIRHVVGLTAACGAVLLGSLVGTLRLYDSPSINPDSYSSMLDLAAVSLWMLSLAATRRVPRRCFGVAAGLLWAASATVKQTGVVGLPALSCAVVALVISRHEDVRRWLSACAFAWIGFGAGIVVVAAELTRNHVLVSAWEAVFIFNHGLLSLAGLSAALTSWPRVWDALEPVQLPLWLAFVGAIATLWTRSDNRLARAVTCAMVFWWVVQVVLALQGPSQTMRYWQATWPPMLWLAAVGVHHLGIALRHLPAGQRSAMVVACATAVLLLGRPLAEHYAHGLARSYLAYEDRRSYGTHRNQLERLATEIRKLVPEGRPIYVWAYDAGVYVQASRMAASRFLYPQSEAQMGEILADLGAGKAHAILVPENDAPEFNRWCDKTCREHLAAILGTYEPGPTVGRYSLWLRPAGRPHQTEGGGRS